MEVLFSKLENPYLPEEEAASREFYETLERLNRCIEEANNLVLDRFSVEFVEESEILPSRLKRLLNIAPKLTSEATKVRMRLYELEASAELIEAHARENLERLKKGEGLIEYAEGKCICYSSSLDVLKKVTEGLETFVAGGDMLPTLRIDTIPKAEDYGNAYSGIKTGPDSIYRYVLHSEKVLV